MTEPYYPPVGTPVHYYNASIIQRVGQIKGYGGRADGPYAAVITNNLGQGCTLLVYFPGMGAGIEVNKVPYQDDPVIEKNLGHWALPTNVAKARFTKEREDHNARELAGKAERDKALAAEEAERARIRAGAGQG